MELRVPIVTNHIPSRSDVYYRNGVQKGTKASDFIGGDEFTLCNRQQYFHIVKIIDIAVNVDHVHIFFQYPPKYSLSFIAKKIKGRSSRILRQEFPHLREWCGEHLRAPGCYHGSVGQGWGCCAEVHFITELFRR